MICVTKGSIIVLNQVSLNIAFYAHAINIFMRIIGENNEDPINTHTIRREILSWIQIWNQNFYFVQAFWRKFFVRKSKKFLLHLSEVRYKILSHFYIWWIINGFELKCNIISKYKSHWIMESLKNHKIQFRNGLKCKTWLLFISITDEIISLDQKPN